MTEVKIPFLSQFEKSLKTGRKFMTSRTRKMAESGDTFTVFGQSFKIASVYKMPLSEVADLYYGPEGFLSGDDFIQTWNRIHPRKPFDRESGQMVWVHQFSIVNLEKDK